MRDWVEQAEYELDNDLDNGVITREEYRRYLCELYQEAEEAGYYGDRNDNY